MKGKWFGGGAALVFVAAAVLLFTGIGSGNAKRKRRIPCGLECSCIGEMIPS